MKKRTWAFALIAVAGASLLVRHVVSEPAANASGQRDSVIDASERNTVIDAAIAELHRAYVIPEKTAAIESDLRERQRRGEFDSITSAQSFAGHLTDVLQEQTGDRHLEVRYFEKPLSVGESGQGTPEEQAIEDLRQRRLNYGFASVGRFPFNIGYIDLHAFARPEHATDRIAAAMTLVSESDALVIDLRKCGGGDPDTVMLFASYLFDAPEHLNDIYFRDEDRTEVRWTTKAVPGIKYGQERMVYLLTSHDTFSACEDITYALKNAHRAVVVGENTGGGAHAGSPQRLDAHFMMFVPSGRPISPVTHTDWEGVGIAPDISAPASDAADVAQVAILRRLLAGEADPERQGEIRERISELD